MMNSEIKWAALINGEVPFRALTPKPLYASVVWKFQSGYGTHLAEKSVYDFSLQDKVIHVPKDSVRFGIELLIRVAAPDGTTAGVLRFGMKWPYTTVHLSDSVRLTFSAKSKDIRVLIPLPPEIRSQLPRGMRKHPSSAAWFGFVGREHPTRMSGFVRQCVTHFSSRELRPKQDHMSNNLVKPGTESQTFALEQWRNSDVQLATTKTLVSAVSKATGAKTPNFRTLKRSEYPVLPYTREVIKTYNTLGYQRISALTGNPTVLFNVGPLEGGPVSVPAPDFQHIGTAEFRAYQSLMSKGNFKVANLAETLAQQKQLDNLIGGNIMKVVGALGHVKRHNFKAAAETLFYGRKPRYRRGGGPSITKGLSQNWLEFQYGWKPLLQDINEVIKAYNRFRLGHALILRAESTALVKTRAVTPIMGPLHWALASVKPFKIGDFEVDKQTRCSLGIRYKIRDPALQHLSQFGLTNPVSLAWELLPYSFVVDWALPIGPYLESLTSFQGLDFVDGYRSKTTRVWQFASAQYNGAHGVKPQDVQIDGKFGFKRYGMRFDREVLKTFPTCPIPSFKSPISTGHSLNALALLRVAMK